jgi:hypothetical protein
LAVRTGGTEMTELETELKKTLTEYNVVINPKSVYNAKKVFTPKEDELLIKLRMNNASFDYIAEKMKISREAVRRRTMYLAQNFPEFFSYEEKRKKELESKGHLQRWSLPPGHPVSWGAISKEPWPGIPPFGASNV